jgi:hypothetical protein
LPSSIQIDFQHIRPLDGDRRKGFEEFVCQLGRRQAPAGVEFRRLEGAGGDGGVEGYWTDETGGEHGYQAKYFVATRDISWTQIDESVGAALNAHLKLTSYVIALACDLTGRTGRLGRGKTGWEHWDAHKVKWEGWATSKGMSVSFVPWTKSNLTDMLASSADRRGLTLFWFNEDVLGQERLRALFERARADLGERFHPEDNVRTGLANIFEGLRRSPEFRGRIVEWCERFPHPAKLIDSTGHLTPKPSPSLVETFQGVCRSITEIAIEVRRLHLESYPLERWNNELEQFWSPYHALEEFVDNIDRGEANDQMRIRSVEENLHQYNVSD